MRHLNELERQGLMSWRIEEHAWVADPDRVVRALTDDGFQEYKREIAKDNRSHATSGGMWQGLDSRTGVVATVIWHATPQEPRLFIEIDSRPFEGNPWAEIDDAVLADAITDEASTRAAAVSTEAATRAAADTSEASTRAAAVSAEAATRAAADTALTGNLTTETQARIDGDDATAVDDGDFGSAVRRRNGAAGRIGHDEVRAGGVDR